MDKEEVHVAESQPLLLPPASIASRLSTCPSHLCDWAQATECTFTSLAPLPCQMEECDILVHHVCKAAWERREGYDDVVALYCCCHHPNYKYRSAPEKGNVETMQEVIGRARVVNVESQITTKDIGDFDIGDEEEKSPTTLQSDDCDEEDPMRGANLDAVVLDECYFSGDDGRVDLVDREDDFGIMIIPWDNLPFIIVGISWVEF